MFTKCEGPVKISKGAKIRNRYNQVPQDCANVELYFAISWLSFGWKLYFCETAKLLYIQNYLHPTFVMRRPKLCPYSFLSFGRHIVVVFVFNVPSTA